MSSMKSAFNLSLVTTAVLCMTPARAAEAGSRSTREFVQAAAQSDQLEISEAQSVLAQSSNPRVRDFASRMIEAHRATSRSLREAASRAGLKPPSPGLSSDQALLFSGLQSLAGPPFDKAYAHHQVLAHRSALNVAQQYAANGDAPEVRQAAASTVPLIAAHLSMAEQLASTMDER